MKEAARIEANELAGKIENTTRQLERAKENVTVAYNKSGSLYTIPLQAETLQAIQAITVASLERDLTVLRAKMEAL